MRNLVITGLSLFLGISVPQLFNEYWVPSRQGLVHTRAGWVSFRIDTALLLLSSNPANRNTCCCFCLKQLQFNAFLNTIFSSPPTVGLIVAVFLDNTLEVEKSKKDRGMPWWVKFRTFRGDNRNEEFYTLPFNLNRFFPPTWARLVFFGLENEIPSNIIFGEVISRNWILERMILAESRG